MTMVAIHVQTTPDRNGNARGGYLWYDSPEAYEPMALLGFVEYQGPHTFAELFQSAATTTHVLAVIQVPPGEFRRMVRAERFRQQEFNRKANR